jgi:RNase adapter protein RapZ
MASESHHSSKQGADPLVMIVTGMSGAGKSTALEVLEDLGWETIDNAPVRLLEGLLTTGPAPDTPLAIGIDSRTRGFDPGAILTLLDRLWARGSAAAGILFLDANRHAITRRYNETRRPHPLARGRPVGDGIKAERELLEPLRARAEIVIDTSDYSVNDLQQVIRNQFADEARSGMTLTVTSFGFARGMPPLADLVFDMRFLDNPHWDPVLRPQTGLDPAVGAHIESDPAFAGAFARIRDLVLELLPRYAEQGRAYLAIAFGCTGGKHRSVYAAEKLATALREAEYEPTVIHRNLSSAPPVPAKARPEQGS